MPLNPSRTLDELRELRELTGDENGAQRVAWTDTWKRAQEWMSSKLAGTGAVESFDAAGNQWWTLPGASEKALIKRLLEFPQEVRESAARRAPHRICAYSTAVAADFQLDPAGACDAPAVGDSAGDAATAAVEQINVVRTEIEQCRA